MQETALLDGAPGLVSLVDVVRRQQRRAQAARPSRCTTYTPGDTTVRRGADGGRQVRDVLGDGVLGADGARVDAVGLAGFGEGVVAAVEVLALLEVLGEVVGAGGELAVEAEEALFFRGEGL